MKKKNNVLILNGPNLNLLGIREKNIYGNFTIEELIKITTKEAKKLNIKLFHIQSNAEHILIDEIHKCMNYINFIIINPAGLSHTSISLRDALLSVNIKFIEVHISNIYKREEFRKNSYISDIADGIICGFGINSYLLALKASAELLK
ncbi:3-dehydroquinate dehydratase [Buchnera aphidicola (Neophyllaphis podocarpi)]|uniref:type II 3-dehydroquinate dehydratase n=1 Tax=Buchnera aphidicola TaxID=9 RepID=UPI0031B83F59